MALATSPITVTAPSSPPPPPPPLSLPHMLVSPSLTLAPLSPPPHFNISDDASSQPNNAEAAASEYQRKRTERMFSCENMRVDADRDLRITGVTKKGSSWQYHIDVLDPRMRMPSFTDPGALHAVPPAASNDEPRGVATTTTTSAHSDDASYAALPPTVRYSVMRRYNDFRQLCLYLTDTFGVEVLDALPPFPDGGWLSYVRGDDPRLLQFRKEHLERFLRALDEHPHLRACRGLTHFLRPDIEALTTIGGVFQRDADTSSAVQDADAFRPSFRTVTTAPSSSSSSYVSLSLVQSPEIRFTKHVSDGRGDRKRRRVPFPLWGSSSSGGTGSSSTATTSVAALPRTNAAAAAAAASASADKRASLTEDEDDDDAVATSNDDKRQQNAPSAAPPMRLMKQLSLDPSA